MRGMRKTWFIFAAVMLAAAGARAGQQLDINSLTPGVKFCPAPGANNSEFMQSYFSVDARTGQMTRHDAGSPGVSIDLEPPAEEQVLFVSPPISVENVYVPPPGGSPVPPRTMATGVMRQPRRAAPVAQPPRARQYPPVQQYPQTRQPVRQPAPAYAPQQYAPVQQYPQQPQVRPQAYPQYAQTQPYPQQQVYAQTQPYPQPARPAYPQPQYRQPSPAQGYQQYPR